MEERLVLKGEKRKMSYKAVISRGGSNLAEMSGTCTTGRMDG